jgi:glutamate N-acetyltransferase/amino-acid N-acetyltransferase
MSNHPYAVPGFDIASLAAGIKKRANALDMALIASPTPCCGAAMFTKNLFPAAPVLYGRRVMAINPDQLHGVIINAGCANACTGAEGEVNTRRTAEAVEQALGASDHSILVMSTGVIGVQLPMQKVMAAVPQLTASLQPDQWENAAQAIMTTDTRPKLATRSLQIEGVDVRLTGIAKGAGMIHPDMATMLSVAVTNANITHEALQQALSQAVNQSFNRISIDGDTSTNDTIIVLANGLAKHPLISTPSDPGYAPFQTALTDLCRELAQAIVRDGEGVTKFVSVTVNGAASDAEAHYAANAIATSPLVKTAFFGSDANWGRILAAAGRSGVRIEADKTSLFINGGPNAQVRLGELQLVAGGTPTAYAEEVAAAIFSQPEIDVRLELDMGAGTATVWTCDLSYDYVKINGDYRS